MTYKSECTLPNELLDQIADHRLDALPELIRTIINAAMQIERQNHLGVGPYERSPERLDQANGYKSKTVATRVGKITFDVPQVREGVFYPQSLEKGLRSERALKLTLAEMYVQGVSTRKVAAMSAGTALHTPQELCHWILAKHQYSGNLVNLQAVRFPYDHQNQILRVRNFQII